MLPHIYQGHVRFGQQPLIKAKISDYGYQTSTGNPSKTLTSFNPKENSKGQVITINHLLHKTHQHKLQQTMEEIENVALTSSMNIQQEKNALTPNDNLFIKKTSTATTQGDFRRPTAKDYPQRVTAQSIEQRKRRFDNHVYPYESMSVAQRPHPPPCSDIETIRTMQRNSRTKTEVSEDFKVSTITQCPEQKKAKAEPTSYPMMECGPSVFLTTKQIDHRNFKESISKANFESTTRDIEGINKPNRQQRIIGYTGHIPDDNNNSKFGRSNSTGKLCRNDGSIHFNRCSLYQATNYGSDMMTGYLGHIPHSMTNNHATRKVFSAQIRRDPLIDTMRRTDIVENPNVTREQYMKEKTDPQVRALFGEGKDKTCFRHNAMVRGFFTKEPGAIGANQFNPSVDGNTNAEMFFASRTSKR